MFDKKDIQYLDIRDILIHQFKDNGKFFRYDMIACYLFVKEWYKKNKPEKFDWKRGVPNFKLHYRLSRNAKDFIKLIKSFEKNGFLEEHPIVLDKRYRWRSGSHRIALSLYFGIEDIPIVFSNKLRKPRYDAEKMYRMGIAKKSIIRMEKVRQKIFKKLGIKK